MVEIGRGVGCFQHGWAGHAMFVWIDLFGGKWKILQNFVKQIDCLPAFVLTDDFWNIVHLIVHLGKNYSYPYP